MPSDPSAPSRPCIQRVPRSKPPPLTPACRSIASFSLPFPSWLGRADGTQFLVPLFTECRSTPVHSLVDGTEGRADRRVMRREGKGNGRRGGFYRLVQLLAGRVYGSRWFAMERRYSTNNRPPASHRPSIDASTMARTFCPATVTGSRYPRLVYAFIKFVPPADKPRSASRPSERPPVAVAIVHAGLVHKSKR